MKHLSLPPLLSFVALFIGKISAERVRVEQFGMVQCPMTSTWLNHFHESCLVHGRGIGEIATFTEHFVGGKSGGPVTNMTWNTSFHGDMEILGDKYHLCVRSQARADKVTLDANRTWVDFEVCMNGPLGVLKPWVVQIPSAAEKCARRLGLDWKALDACARGDEGTQLYRQSVFYTSSQEVNYVAGKIPVIRINDKIYRGLDAYTKLGSRICEAYGGGSAPPIPCGCGEIDLPPAISPPKETVTLTHYSDAQCPCSARVPSDIGELFLSSSSGFQTMVRFEQKFVGDLKKNVSKCIHGEGECIAQRHFACAQKQSASDEWIAFERCCYGKCTDCAAIEGPQCPCQTYTNFTEFSKNDIMAKCAADTGLDWATLHACAIGSEGQTLMERSSAQSNADGVTYGVDGLAPIYLDGVKIRTKKPIPLVCGPTPEEVKLAVCTALKNKGATPVACS